MLEASLCSKKPIPVGSKTDPLLLAEPISDSGSTSVITTLRRRKYCGAVAAGREREYVSDTTLQIPRSVKKEG